MNELLWFASRAAGVASIVLLTAVVVLGLLTSGRRRPDGPRAAVVMGVHRSLALGTLAFLTAHIATAVAETYVSIDAISVVVPFTAGCEPFWVGLGTLAVDPLAAVVVTSLLRQHLPERVWKGIHLAAFALWPLALVHGLGMGTSAEPLLRASTAGCAVVGLAAVGWRLTRTTPDAERRRAIAAQEWS